MSVLLCHPACPNDEDLNIWEELDANKLPAGKHEIGASIAQCSVRS